MKTQLSLFEQSVLEGVAARGSTSGCYDFVANKVGLTKDDMQEKVFRGEKAGYVGKWQHKIRVVQQKLKAMGLIEKANDRGSWRMTGAGKDQLTFVPINGMKLYYTTENGMAFWGDSMHLPDTFSNSIDLVITSPPYLLQKPRKYGHIGMNEQEYVDNLVSAIENWLPMLTPTASIVLNIGNSIKAGEGYQNLHKESLLLALRDRLGLFLIQKFYWYSPTKMPSGHWVNIAHRDCVDSVEDFYWLSMNPKQCKADNRQVLVEYSKTQRRYMKSAQTKSGVRKNPSGQSVNEETFYADRGGAIPSNLLFAVPEGANSQYSRYCRENNLPRHPAMFSPNLPDFFIRYLTNIGDVVADFYFGSGSTGYASESQNRHWIGAEIVKEYLDGSMGRFLNRNIKKLH
ncbi:MAG: site-specific DNA-methyltransferase [Pseudomonadota bacterium]|nr:site-specific DNA-methyltransferase [Pseudomonadota bacterium]